MGKFSITIQANYPQEIAQDEVWQSNTGHMTGLWFLPSPAFKAEYLWMYTSLRGRHQLTPQQINASVS